MNYKYYEGMADRSLAEDPLNVFVFGSNRQGLHGAGAAFFAKRYWGAQQGMGEGLWGQSYALPTREFIQGYLKTRKLSEIDSSVRQFIRIAHRCASLEPARKFIVTRVGCGLAGLTDELIAPMFFGAPANCVMPIEWRAILEAKAVVTGRDHE